MAYEDYIRENLYNLGELEKNDFRYLSENISQYFSESYSEIQLNLIIQLFKKISHEYFPDGFNLTEVNLIFIDNQFYLRNSFHQYCFEENGTLYYTPIFTSASADEFKSAMNEILQSNSENFRWKIKQYSKDKYEKCDNYTFKNKCAVSIKDGEIINILKANKVDIRDIDIIQQAVELGGKRIECYIEDFSKYVNCGFTPVSICRWDDNRAPKEWIRLNKFTDDSWKNKSDDRFIYPRQDIIFFIYTGNKDTISFNDFISQVDYSDSYEDAKSLQIIIYKQLIGGK